MGGPTNMATEGELAKTLQIDAIVNVPNEWMFEIAANGWFDGPQRSIRDLRWTAALGRFC